MRFCVFQSVRNLIRFSIGSFHFLFPPQNCNETFYIFTQNCNESTHCIAHSLWLVQSNKCKGDHGMGPCVVKRTDEDPDSDGEDETKAAYYADKGKTPRSPRKPRGAYTKKRKRKDDGAPPTKRARVDPTGPGVPPPMQPIPTQQQPAYNTTLPPPPSNGGYYHQGGYAHNTNGYGNNYNFNGSNGHHQSQPTPPIPNPPPMDYADGMSQHFVI